MNAAEIVDFYVANKLNQSADVRAEGEYSAVLDWQCPTPDRANRRSRLIRIVLGREYVEDFNELPEDAQENWGVDLAERVTIELAGFDPLSDERDPVEIFP